jgi:hypothetical protein
MRPIDLWVNTTLEGYIIEFVVDNHPSFSQAEVDFKKDARGRMLREIPLWIKVFLFQSEYKINYLNKKFNGEITKLTMVRSGLTLK